MSMNINVSVQFKLQLHLNIYFVKYMCILINQMDYAYNIITYEY